MNITFSYECIQTATKDIKHQISWAWSNFQQSTTQHEQDAWWDCTHFWFQQYCELRQQMEYAPREHKEYYLVHETDQKTA